MHMGAGGEPITMHICPLGQCIVAQVAARGARGGGGGPWLAITLTTNGAVMSVVPRWNWANIL